VPIGEPEPEPGKYETKTRIATECQARQEEVQETPNHQQYEGFSLQRRLMPQQVLLQDSSQLPQEEKTFGLLPRSLPASPVQFMMIYALYHCYPAVWEALALLFPTSALEMACP
jgi:hypothetical protein